MEAVTTAWSSPRLGRAGAALLAKYAALVTVPFVRVSSVLGFALLIAMVIQVSSGILLALYYVPDPSYVMTFREEYFSEVWWFAYVHKAHVVGVDLIFVFSYAHLLKKLALRNYVDADADGWVTGTYAFLVYHIVVFLGITLSTNHLGDVTITIAANVFWSLFARWHKSYCIVFGNKHLNVDQLTRFMIAHYVAAWYYTYLLQTHLMFIHEAWDSESSVSAPQDTAAPKQSWLWDALGREGGSMALLYLSTLATFVIVAHPEVRVVNFGFFEQWSETEVEDINFFAVAPHWYFRAHMGLLTVCAQHYEGLFWLVAFYALLAFQPLLYRLFNASGLARAKSDAAPLPTSPVQSAFFLGFVAALTYAGGTLPCGRFYYEEVEGFFGNVFVRASYQYIYAYLGVILHASDIAERRVVSMPAALLAAANSSQAPTSGLTPYQEKLAALNAQSPAFFRFRLTPRNSAVTCA